MLGLKLNHVSKRGYWCLIYCMQICAPPFYKIDVCPRDIDWLRYITDGIRGQLMHMLYSLRFFPTGNIYAKQHTDWYIKIIYFRLISAPKFTMTSHAKLHNHLYRVSHVFRSDIRRSSQYMMEVIYTMIAIGSNFAAVIVITIIN